jgi:cytochrome c oxidase subunit 4
MSTELKTTHQEPNYMAIFWWLLALTLIEVGVVYLHIGRIYLITALIILAFAKAFLVAWYFMHLKFEKLSLILIVIIPLALAVDLFLGILPDVGLLPF